MPIRLLFFPTASGGITYTFSVSGGVSFSGIAVYNKERVSIPQGNITFSGTAPITFTGGATYTITPTGGITFTGVGINSHTKIQVPLGNVTFSGVNTFIRERNTIPSGNISFSGDVIWNKTFNISPTGQITFSGSAPLYMPGSTIDQTSVTLTFAGHA